MGLHGGGDGAGFVCAADGALRGRVKRAGSSCDGELVCKEQQSCGARTMARARKRLVRIVCIGAGRGSENRHRRLSKLAAKQNGHRETSALIALSARGGDQRERGSGGDGDGLRADRTEFQLVYSRFGYPRSPPTDELLRLSRTAADAENRIGQRGDGSAHVDQIDEKKYYELSNRMPMRIHLSLPTARERKQLRFALITNEPMPARDSPAPPPLTETPRISFAVDRVFREQSELANSEDVAPRQLAQSDRGKAESRAAQPRPQLFRTQRSRCAAFQLAVRPFRALVEGDAKAEALLRCSYDVMISVPKASVSKRAVKRVVARRKLREVARLIMPLHAARGRHYQFTLANEMLVASADELRDELIAALKATGSWCEKLSAEELQRPFYNKRTFNRWHGKPPSRRHVPLQRRRRLVKQALLDERGTLGRGDFVKSERDAS